MAVIKVTWDVSKESGTISIDLLQLDCKSIKVWNALSDEEKRSRIQKSLDNEYDQPYMVLDTFTEPKIS